jgi:hypothetical protein
MAAPDRKLRVGVSLHIREGSQSMWENGIFQNCAFLVQLLNRSPAVEKAVLVNGSGVAVVPDGLMLEGSGLAMIGLDEAQHSLDVVIEMSALLPLDWTQQFRDRGGRVAWMRVGNDYVIDIERAMFDKPSGSIVSAKKYDAVWTLAQYENTCKDYFALTARAPVHFVPHLWTPYFFDRAVAGLPGHLKYGYQPGRARWRVCMFEPNVCTVKTSFVPMLACEEAYRRSPAFLEHVRVLNTFHMKEDVTFVHFARSLDIVNHGLASFEGRFPTYEFMAGSGDCIVSHQWENAQNYLYYEALYGGYPLVHNSPLIRDCGYYYPDFDCQAGANALLRAFDCHDAGLPSYRMQASQLLRRLDVENPENVAAYTRELLLLYENRTSGTV